VVGGRLELRWSYSARRHRRETIARLAWRMLDHLEALSDHCQAPDAGGHSPADFPDVALSQADLEAILMELEVGDTR
jgi:non-ribosomal peptide synthase protein (TIGR01720 family)